MDSSTSNSNSRLPRPPWARVWVTALLLVIGGIWFVHDAPLEIFTDPTRPEKKLAHLAREVGLETARPRLVILGSSRATFSVVPGLLERQLGRPAGFALNCGYPAYGFRDINSILDRFPASFTSTAVFVLFVDEAFLLRLHEPAPATGTDTFQTPAGKMEQALRDTARPLMPPGERAAWLRYRASVLFHIQRPYTLPWHADADRFLADETMLHRTLPNPPPQPVLTAYYESLYLNREFDPQLAASYTELGRRLKAGGAKLLLVQMPAHPALHHRVMQEQAAVYESNKAEWGKIAQQLGARYYCFDEIQECSLTPQMYADPLHLNQEGANAFTRFLAEKVIQPNLGGL